MHPRLTRRTLLGGLAGSAATAILAACGGAKATDTPKAAVTAAASTPATVASTRGTTAPAAATIAPTTALTVAPAPAAANTTASSPAITAPASTPATMAITSGTTVPGGAAANASLSGKVTLYTSAVQADADGLKAAFNKAYPNIAVTIYRDGTEKVIAKLRAEADAKSVQADVLLLADAPTMENLKADKLLQPYKPAGASALPQAFVEPDGYYLGTKIINTGIAVNTTASVPKPAMWKDLLKADYKAKLVSPSPQYSGAAALNYTVFLNSKDYGLDFLKGLKANNMTIVMANGDVISKVVSGEAPVGIVTDNAVRAAKAKGSPIDLIYPTDGAIPITEPIAIAAGTKNLDAAKAFIDFVLSADGQSLIASQNYIPLLASVMAPAGVPKDLKEFAVDAKAVAAQLADAKKQFSDLFGT